MGLGVLLSGVAVAGGVGMSCGTCCGSGISAFLSGYMMTHARSFRESLSGFVKFYLGKILAVVSICIATSLAGSRLMNDEGYIGQVPLIKVVDLCMIGMALWLLYDLWRERSGRKSCVRCSHAETLKEKSGKNAEAPCGHEGTKPSEALSKQYQGVRRNQASQYFDKKMSGTAIFLMGAGYGITPCAPLILIAGYCASLPFLYAAAVGTVFAIASAVSPMLILLLLSGVLAGRVYREIPKYLDWFRAACYFAVIGYFAYSFISGGSVVA